MPRLGSLDDLLVHGLQNLYHAEGQTLRALPRLVRSASNRDLKDTLEDHRQQTDGTGHNRRHRPPPSCRSSELTNAPDDYGRDDFQERECIR